MTSIDEYKILLPGAVPAPPHEAFFRADQKYVAGFQRKINEFLNKPGMREFFNDPSFGPLPDLEINGRFGVRDAIFIERLAQLDPAKSPHIREMQKSLPALQKISEFHLSPPKDYREMMEKNPVIGLKILLQQGEYTRSDFGGGNMSLVVNNKVDDWQLAFATRKLAQDMQKAANEFLAKNGEKPLPEIGDYLPEMRKTMERMLKDPEYANIKPLWDAYSRISPEQHKTMEEAMDRATNRFLKIYGFEQKPIGEILDFFENTDEAKLLKQLNNMPDTNDGFSKKANINFAIAFRGHFVEHALRKRNDMFALPGMDEKSQLLQASQHVAYITYKAQDIAFTNLSNTAFAQYIEAKTGIRPDDFETKPGIASRIKPGDMNDSSEKLIRAILEYPELPKLEGMNPDTEKSIREVASLSKEEINIIQKAPLRILSEEVAAMGKLFGSTYSPEEPPAISKALATTYVTNINLFNKLSASNGADKDTLLKAAQHIKIINQSIDSMTPGQQEEFANAIQPHIKRLEKPMIQVQNDETLENVKRPTPAFDAARADTSQPSQTLAASPDNSLKPYASEITGQTETPAATVGTGGPSIALTRPLGLNG